MLTQSRSAKRSPMAGVEGSARSAPRTQRPERRGSGAVRTPLLVGGAGAEIRRGRGSPALLNVEEAAALLGVARDTVYRAIRAGTLPLPVYVIGRRMRIPRRGRGRGRRPRFEPECRLGGLGFGFGFGRVPPRRAAPSRQDRWRDVLDKPGEFGRRPRRSTTRRGRAV